MRLFNGLNLLYQERLKAKSSVAFLDGIVVCSVRIDHFIAMNQNELSFVCRQLCDDMFPFLVQEPLVACWLNDGPYHTFAAGDGFRLRLP